MLVDVSVWHYLTEMCCGSEAGSYWRLKDSCITQLEDQESSRTCNESKEEEEENITELSEKGLSFSWTRSVEVQLLRRDVQRFRDGLVCKAHRLVYHSTLGWRVIKKKEKEELPG